MGIKRLVSAFLAGLLLFAGCARDPLPPITTANGNPAGGILPGSKGDRKHLAALEVQLQLPALASADFAIKALAVPPALDRWTATVDGKQVGLSFQAATEVEGEVLLSFVLSDVGIAETGMQEFLFHAEDKVLQAAGLVPRLGREQKRLSAPLTSESTAVWMIARNYQKGKGKALQDLTPEQFALLQALPEVKTLAQSLKQLYRQSKGKADPTKSEHLNAQADQGSVKLDQKVKQTPAPEPSSNPGTSPAPSPSSKGNTPKAQPSTGPEPDGPPGGQGNGPGQEENNAAPSGQASPQQSPSPDPSPRNVNRPEAD